MHNRLHFYCLTKVKRAFILSRVAKSKVSDANYSLTLVPLESIRNFTISETNKTFDQQIKLFSLINCFLFHRQPTMVRSTPQKPSPGDAAAQNLSKILVTKSSQSIKSESASEASQGSEPVRVKTEPADSSCDRARASSVDTVIVDPLTPERSRNSAQGSRASSVDTIICTPPASPARPRGGASGAPRGGARGVSRSRRRGGSRDGARGGVGPSGGAHGGPSGDPPGSSSSDSSSDSSPVRPSAVNPQPRIADKSSRKTVYKSKDGTMKKRYRPGEYIV